MAIVKLQNVEVTRVNSSGHGVQVAEKFQVQGKERQTRYTVWFEEPHGLAVGNVISVSGFLGAKVGDPWTGQDGQERRSVEFSVNKPRIDTGQTAQGGSNAGSQGQWASAPAAQENGSQGGSSGFGNWDEEAAF